MHKITKTHFLTSMMIATISLINNLYILVFKKSGNFVGLWVLRSTQRSSWNENKYSNKLCELQWEVKMEDKTWRSKPSTKKNLLYHILLPFQKQESQTLVCIAPFTSINFNRFWKSRSHHCHRSHSHSYQTKTCLTYPLTMCVRPNLHIYAPTKQKIMQPNQLEKHGFFNVP